jgi:hypothetical protein
MKFDNKHKMLANCTLLISGPLVSRVKENELIKYFLILNELKNQYGLTIIISTYPNELTQALKNFQFRFILNDDPGLDCYYTGAAILKSRTNIVTRNTTRMLSTTSSGLSQVRTEYVIKTRVEILPSKIEFAQALYQVLENYLESEVIVFLAEHYTGLTYTENKPLLLWMPDVFHIMRTNDSLKLWVGALNLWQKYKINLVGRSFNVDLANEQVLGLSLVHNFIKPISKKNLKKYHRYTCSMKFIRANLIFENYMFRSIYYDELFLGHGRFRYPNKQTPTVTLPLSQTKKQKIFIVFNFFVRGRIFLIKSLFCQLMHFSSFIENRIRNKLEN